MKTVKIKKLMPYSGVTPAYASYGASGMDLYACGNHIINPGKRELVHTAVALELPEDCVGLICSRSGLATKYGIIVLNSPGILDQDYRGEVGVLLFNTGDQAYEITPGDRIAQLIVLPCEQMHIVCVDALSDTARGSGGFGSTGR